MTNNAPELLECPFCGGKPYMHIKEHNPGNETWVTCQSCQATSVMRNNYEAVAAAWNTRTSTLQARHDELVRVVEGMEGAMRYMAHLLMPQSVTGKH